MSAFIQERSVEFLLGGSEVLGHPIKSELDLYNLVKEGLSKTALLVLAHSIKVPIREIAHMINVSERTIQRKTDSDIFPEHISESILQVAQVYAKGAEVFESPEKFKRWLHSTNKALGDKKPNEMISTHYGTQMVLDLLVKIEYGVIS